MKIPTATASSSSRKACAAAERLRALAWLDYIPLAPLAVAAVLMALSPPFDEPHLWEKLKLLFTGRLVERIDIFDLALHAVLPLLLLLKFLRVLALSRARSP